MTKSSEIGSALAPYKGKCDSVLIEKTMYPYGDLRYPKGFSGKRELCHWLEGRRTLQNAPAAQHVILTAHCVIRAQTS